MSSFLGIHLAEVALIPVLALLSTKNENIKQQAVHLSMRDSQHPSHPPYECGSLVNKLLQSKHHV